MIHCVLLNLNLTSYHFISMILCNVEIFAVSEFFTEKPHMCQCDPVVYLTFRLQRF